MTFEQFISNKSEGLMYHITTQYDDKYDIYVYDHFGCLYSLDAWIRSHNTGDSFYCGSAAT